MATKNFNLSEDLVGLVNPKRLPDYTSGGPNTPGWEDSAEISRDGTNLSFTYLPFDMINQVFNQKTIWTGPRTTERPGMYQVFQSAIYSKKCVNGNFSAGITKPIANQYYELVGCQQVEKDIQAWNNEDMMNHTRKLYARCDRGTFEITGLEAYKPDNPHFAIVTPSSSMMFFDGIEPGSNTTKRNIYGVILDVNFKNIFMLKLPSSVNTGDMEEAQPYYYNGLLYFSREYSEIIETNLTTGATRTVLKLKKKDRITGIGEPSRDVFGNLYFVSIFNMGTYFDCDICRGKLS